MAAWMPVAFVTLIVASSHAAPPGRQSEEDSAGWAWYGGDAGGNRYSEAAQIGAGNVDRLTIAWTYRTGELGAGFARAEKLAFEATPILVRDTLFLSTPTSIVIALDPATGHERWRYDPKIPRDVRYSEGTSRGVSSWIDPAADSVSSCAHRIFIGTLDARLLAIDGSTGKPCADFGTQGSVDLTQGIRPTHRGNYLVTSPPAIWRDVVITGSAIGDNGSVELERGIVRAFDARTGALRWSWNPIPLDDALAQSQGWSAPNAQRTGAANA